MKYLSVAICFILISVSQLSAQSKRGYTITGYLKNLSNKKIYLGNKAEGYSGAFKVFFFDSTISVNGHFYFKGKVKEADYRSIEVSGIGGWQTFIIENSNIYIEGNADSIWKAKISGSKEDSLRKKIIKTTAILTDSLNATFDLWANAKGKGDSVSAKNYSEQNNFYTKKIALVRYEFIKLNPDYYVSLLQLNNIQKKIGSDSLKEIFNSLSPSIKSHSKTADIYYRLFKLDSNVLLNKKAPNFKQQDTALRWVTLDSYKGKYVLLDFWASWCGPCRAENPNMLTAYEKYKNSNFEILGIALDTDLKKWKNAIAEDKLPWRQVSDLNGGQNKVGLLYGIETIPMNFLINPAGVIVEKNLRDVDLLKALEKYLGIK